MFEDQVSAKGIGLYDNVGAPVSLKKQEAASGRPWSVLKQQNAAYDPERMTKEEILYEGGFQMNDADVAKEIAPKLRMEESDTVYKERIQSAAYTPTFNKLVTGLISNLFSQDLSIMEATDHNDEETAGDEYTPVLRDFYKEFENDCDGNGTSLHNFVRKTTELGLVHQCSYFGLDYPSSHRIDLAEISLLEQEQLGLDQPFLYHIDQKAVIDWKYQSGNHCFQWLKLLAELHYQETPFDPPLKQFEIKIWMMNDEGYAEYKIFRTRPIENEQDLQDQEIIPLIDQGTTSFTRIPIFKMFFDDGICVGKKLAPMAAEHFARTTLENHMTNKACLTIPVVNRGSMLPAMTSAGPGELNPSLFDLERGSNPKARINNNGIVELGDWAKDRMTIVEAEGKALGFIHKQNQDLDEKMHSVIHQMGQSLQSGKAGQSTNKSALSKQEDRHAMEMLLTAIADVIFDMVQVIFDCIAETRGEDIVFEVQGLSSGSRTERDVLVNEVKLVLPSVSSIPSITFHKEYMYRLAAELIEGTGQETLKTIRKEIEESNDASPLPTTNEQAEMDKEQEQKGAASSSSGSSGSSGSAPSAVPSSPAEIDPKTMFDRNQSTAGVAQTVLEQLKDDYSDRLLDWIPAAHWLGPLEVPLDAIDDSNRSNWDAASRTAKIEDMAEKMEEGWSKPIILVNEPNGSKLSLIDGHTRFLATESTGEKTISAFVAYVGGVAGPWRAMHDLQREGDNGGKRVLSSNQKQR